jgi:hypothetical protein
MSSYININNTTAASPGLQVPTPGQPLQGIPPNMSVMAAISAGLLPANVLQTSMGTRDSRPGRTMLESLGQGSSSGMGLSAVNPYGWPNGGTAGGNSLGAGGLDQVDGPSGGETSVLIGSAQGTQATANGGLQPPAVANSPVLTIPAQPVYQG